MNLFTVAKVAVENTAYSFDMLFDYSVPDFKPHIGSVV